MKDIYYLAIAAAVAGVAIAIRHYINKDDEPKDMNPTGIGNGDDETDYEEQKDKMLFV